MWEEVIRSAFGDAKATGAVDQLESIRVVYCQAWQYDDAAQRLADRLGADPKHKQNSGIGGTVPQVLLTDAATSIHAGDLDLAVVVGAEALATRRQFKKADRKVEWSFAPEQRPPFPFDIPFHPAEVAHSIFEAYLTFALFDTARRARIGESPAAHQARLGAFMSPLTTVAATNPEAWFPIERSPQELSTPTADNRLVASPYTKLLVSIMDVDMAAAVLIASDAKADALGVPLDQRVYLRGAGYAEDPYYVAERDDLSRSAAMSVASAAALGSAHLGIDDIAHLDLYSCFASSLGFAIDALGVSEQAVVDRSRSLTVTGGLPYHGGPGSNYMTHSIATMADVLRKDPGSFGLVSGVGMHMTKHGYAVYSTDPGPFVPVEASALRARVEERQPKRAITDLADGEARIATSSLLYGRDGKPQWGAFVCDLPDGSRCYARADDEGVLQAAESEDLVGVKALLRSNDKVNVLTLL
jgi:acetyl-CoA C-acetyltransferase